MKNFFMLLLAIGLVSTEKLDKTYLPPPGSKYSGGSAGDLVVPFEVPKNAYTTTSSLTPGQNNGIITPEDIRPTIGSQRTGLNIPTQTNELVPITPSPPLPFNTYQNTYKVPTTTTSYAFTQTTTFPTTDGFETTINPIGAGLPFDGSLGEQGFNIPTNPGLANNQPNQQFYPNVIQSGTQIGQQPGTIYNPADIVPSFQSFPGQIDGRPSSNYNLNQQNLPNLTTPSPTLKSAVQHGLGHQNQEYPQHLGVQPPFNQQGSPIPAIYGQGNIQSTAYPIKTAESTSQQVDFGRIPSYVPFSNFTSTPSQYTIDQGKITQSTPHPGYPKGGPTYNNDNIQESILQDLNSQNLREHPVQILGQNAAPTVGPSATRYVDQFGNVQQRITTNPYLPQQGPQSPQSVNIQDFIPSTTDFQGTLGPQGIPNQSGLPQYGENLNVIKGTQSPSFYGSQQGYQPSDRGSTISSPENYLKKFPTLQQQGNLNSGFNRNRVNPSYNIAQEAITPNSNIITQGRYPSQLNQPGVASTLPVSQGYNHLPQNVQQITQPGLVTSNQRFPDSNGSNRVGIISPDNLESAQRFIPGTNVIKPNYIGTPTQLIPDSVNKQSIQQIPFKNQGIDSERQGFPQTQFEDSQNLNLPGSTVLNQTQTPTTTSFSSSPIKSGAYYSTTPVYPKISQQEIPSANEQLQPQRPQAESDRNAVILNYDNVLTPEGFAYSFDTSNGIHADENGTAIGGVKADGSYSYIGDDGQFYKVVYSADENGFRPQGDHLPTPPPVPAAIQKIIDQAAKDREAGISHDGFYDEAKYGHKKYQKPKQRGPQTQEENITNGADIPDEQILGTTNDKSKSRSQNARRPIISTSDIKPDDYEDTDIELDITVNQNSKLNKSSVKRPSKRPLKKKPEHGTLVDGEEIYDTLNNEDTDGKSRLDNKEQFIYTKEDSSGRPIIDDNDGDLQETDRIGKVPDQPDRYATDSKYYDADRGIQNLPERTDSKAETMIRRLEGAKRPDYIPGYNKHKTSRPQVSKLPGSGKKYVNEFNLNSMPQKYHSPTLTEYEDQEENIRDIATQTLKPIERGQRPIKRPLKKPNINYSITDDDFENSSESSEPIYKLKQFRKTNVSRIKPVEYSTSIESEDGNDDFERNDDVKFVQKSRPIYYDQMLKVPENELSKDKFDNSDSGYKYLPPQEEFGQIKMNKFLTRFQEHSERPVKTRPSKKTDSKLTTIRPFITPNVYSKENESKEESEELLPPREPGKNIHKIKTAQADIDDERRDNLSEYFDKNNNSELEYGNDDYLLIPDEDELATPATHHYRPSSDRIKTKKVIYQYKTDSTPVGQGEISYTPSPESVKDGSRYSSDSGKRRRPMQGYHKIKGTTPGYGHSKKPQVSEPTMRPQDEYTRVRYEPSDSSTENEYFEETTSPYDFYSDIKTPYKANKSNISSTSPKYGSSRNPNKSVSHTSTIAPIYESSTDSEDSDSSTERDADLMGLNKYNSEKSERRPDTKIRPTSDTFRQKSPGQIGDSKTPEIPKRRLGQQGIQNLPSTTYRPNYFELSKPGVSVDRYGRPITQPGSTTTSSTATSSSVPIYQDTGLPTTAVYQESGNFRPGQVTTTARVFKPTEQRFGQPSGAVPGQTEFRPTSGSVPSYLGPYPSSTERIIGEDFSGPKQPQRFDPETGYHY